MNESASPIEPAPPTNPSPSVVVTTARPQDNIPTRPQVMIPTDRQVIEDLSRSTKASFESLTNLVLDFGQRLIALENRANQSSDRARAPSEHDLDAQAKIAAEIGAREALALQVATIASDVGDVKSNVAVVAKLGSWFSKWWRTPKAEAIRYALWIAFLAWAGHHNIHFTP